MHTGRKVVPKHLRRAAVTAGTLGLATLVSLGGVAQAQDPNAAQGDHGTVTPIKHLVVIFQENVSFDHYFGTYPNAVNPSGEPAFHAAANTPAVNGLVGPLLTNNPNQSNPQRLNRSQAATCDQDHAYTAEQKAFDRGVMDLFVQNTGNGLTLQQCLTAEGNPTPAAGTDPNYAVMDYYDGNTVTALWSYAQQFAMSDNSYGDTFGPSTPGAVNVTAGNTFGAICGPTSAVYQAPSCTAAPGATAAQPGQPTVQGPGTTYSDADPNYDVCSATQDKKPSAETIQMGGKNVGDLLNENHVTWGWFQGGFASPSYVPGQPTTDDPSTVCTGTHTNVLGKTVTDYNPHHAAFQYYASTANPQHLPPNSVAAIGQQDQANHQYDQTDFFAAADHDNLPTVSYLKAAEYQDGHAGYSDPLGEQRFLVETINHLEKLDSWKDTAVVIAYDDSDGWYDHQMGPVVTQSQTPLDALTDAGACGTDTSRVPDGQQARCGVGPRLPLLVISPYSKTNFVDSAFSTQASVVRFIEDSWLHGERIGGGSVDATTGSLSSMLDFDRHDNHSLFLDPATGEPTDAGQHG